MLSRRSIALAASALALVGTAQGAAAATAESAAAAPVVADADADAFLLYSAWATENSVELADCTGTGPARRLPGGPTAHASFRCGIEVGGKQVGTVVAKALGPEWFRVVSVSGGALKADRGTGTVPKGPLTLDSGQAATALEGSAWGKANDVESAFCSGVGAYRETATQYLFFAFSCATLDTFASRGPHVLVTVSGKSSVRVVRTLSS